jgi:hypothetical protein
MLAANTTWLEWLSDNWGDLASCVGLAVSIWLLFISRGARKASQEARAAVFRRNLVDDLRGFSEDVQFVVSLVQSCNWGLAASRCSRLLQGLHFFSGRWEGVLNSDSRKSLTRIIVQMDTAHTQLLRFATQLPTGEDLRTLTSALSKVAVIVAQQIGKHESLLQAAPRGERQ